jgi:hypothetical protein
MPKYVDYYGQPTESAAVAEEAARRNARDLASAQAEGRDVGVDYFGQATTDPRAIERGAERNIRDVLREGGGGGKAKVDEDLNAGASAMKKGGVAKSAKYMSFSKAGKPAGMKKVTKMASGGMTSSASKRADGIAVKGKTRGKMV